MRLKKHREDVKDLRLMADAHVQDIARRYMNLIRMVEFCFTEMEKDGEDTAFKEVKRVLKDAE